MMHFLIGFAIAVAVGLTGIGGGSFTVPALVLIAGIWLGFTPISSTTRTAVQRSVSPRPPETRTCSIQSCRSSCRKSLSLDRMTALFSREP